MMSFDSFLILYGLLSLATYGFSLRLLELKVPTVIDVRGTAVLVCEFDLEGDKFLSLKWYKEELEFFRYMPNFVPRTQIFKVEGINLMESKSNISAIVLSPLEYKSSGMYRCEVSAEAPHFKVVYRHANMTVLGLPEENPRIEGVQSSYSIGSYVTANCTSSPSYPPARMDWFINGAKVTRGSRILGHKAGDGTDGVYYCFQAQQWFLDYYFLETPENEFHLESRTIGLKFQADESHFQQNDGILSLVCIATVADYTRSSETKAYLTRLTKEKFAQQFTNYYGRNKGEFLLLVALIIVTHL